jgi:hypothetical protein
LIIGHLPVQEGKKDEENEATEEIESTEAMDVKEFQGTLVIHHWHQFLETNKRKHHLVTKLSMTVLWQSPNRMEMNQKMTKVRVRVRVGLGLGLG